MISVCANGFTILSLCCMAGCFALMFTKLSRTKMPSKALRKLSYLIIILSVIISIVYAGTGMRLKTIIIKNISAFNINKISSAVNYINLFMLLSPLLIACELLFTIICLCLFRRVDSDPIIINKGVIGLLLWKLATVLPTIIEFGMRVNTLKVSAEFYIIAYGVYRLKGCMNLPFLYLFQNETSNALFKCCSRRPLEQTRFELDGKRHEG